VYIFTFTALKAQNFQLIGLIDNKLVLIDSLTGALQAQATINNIALGDHVNLTYHYEKDLYYTILSPNEAPKLVSITKEGDYQIIGALMYNGNPVPLCDALAYNPVRKKLYAGASLNGGVLQNDFYTESIVEIDPDTGVCSLITTISTNLPLPDIDVMAFEGDVMYFFDGAPPGVNFLYFYKLDFVNIGSISFPQVIYQSTYINIEDFTVTSQNIYFTEGRNLRRFNLSNGTLHFVGTTHSPAQFNGKLIRGIGKMLACSPPTFDLGEDKISCINSPVILNVSCNDCSYLWSNGTTEQTLTASETGEYWVEVTNACSKKSDDIFIIFENFPVIDLGGDKTICNNEDIELNASFSGALYEWQDGSTQPFYLAHETGVYWVNVQNSCGSFIDSISILFQVSPSIDLGEDEIVCDTEELILVAPFYNNTNYLWSTRAIEPTVTINQTGTYSIEIFNDCGSAQDTVNIKFSIGDLPFIPNVFTPNGDYKNESFEIDEVLMGSSLKVFNRWGKLVFESANYLGDWQAEEVASGVYYYTLQDYCHKEYRGSITIIH
jgi:gliding motility-associated-like protein